MSNLHQSHNAGHSHGHNQVARAEEWVQSNKDHSISGGPNASFPSAFDDSSHNQPQLHRPISQTPSADSHQSSHGHDDHNPGVLQQTGEQVMHMAQGAVDTVKNTLGMGHDDHKK